MDEPASFRASFPGCECSAGERQGRLVDPTTCERDYTTAETEFMMAMNEYKRRSGRMFPTWSEVLEVLHGLGYEKLSPAELNKRIGSGEPGRSDC